MDLTALPEKRGRGRPRKYSQPAEEINEYKYVDFFFYFVIYEMYSF